MGKLLLALVVVPLVDLWLLWRLADHVGFWWVLAFVIASGMLGGRLARMEGARVLEGVRRAQAEGRVPEEGLLSALLVMVAGVLLVIPGLISSALGLLLLLPPVRRLCVFLGRRWLEKQVARGTVHVVGMSGGVGGPFQEGPFPGEPGLDDAIDVEAVEVPPRELPPGSPEK